MVCSLCESHVWPPSLLAVTHFEKCFVSHHLFTSSSGTDWGWLYTAGTIDLVQLWLTPKGILVSLNERQWVVTIYWYVTHWRWRQADTLKAHLKETSCSEVRIQIASMITDTMKPKQSTALLIFYWQAATKQPGRKPFSDWLPCVLDLIYREGWAFFAFPLFFSAPYACQQAVDCVSPLLL